MTMVGFPLLLVPLAIYNIIVWLMPGVSLAEPLVKLTLVSGAEWPVTLSDILLVLGVVLLLLEVIKGARPGAKYLTDHLLSLVLFGATAAEFVLWPRFGTSTYFLLSLLSLVDFLSGIALRSRRVTVAAAARPVPAAPAPEPASEVPMPEPHFDPAPVPAAASVAESVLMDRPAPKVATAEAAPASPSPEIPSPGLQPGQGSAPSPDQPR
jgi:hypothetical protein